MSEIQPNPERNTENSYLQEVITALRGMREIGVDFEESDIDHLAAMEEDELYEYVFQALMEVGEDSPEQIMVRLGIVEAFRKYNEAEIVARNSKRLKGEDYYDDQLDELDRQQGRGSYGREQE